MGVDYAYGVVDSPKRILNCTDLSGTPGGYDINIGVGAFYNDRFNDNLSDRTLKTILNLHSDRAQTQQ